MRNGEKFKPDSLPDAGGPCVIAAEGIILFALLSGRDKTVSLIVLCMDGEDVDSCLHELRDVGEKGYISSLVPAALPAVYIDRRLVVNRSEMKADYSLQLFIGYFKCAAVPDGIHEITVGNPGETALRTERDVYLSGKCYSIGK